MRGTQPGSSCCRAWRKRARNAQVAVCPHRLLGGALMGRREGARLQRRRSQDAVDHVDDGATGLDVGGHHLALAAGAAEGAGGRA